MGGRDPGGINQREWSVSYPRSATEQSARIRAYQVHVSNNNSSWTSVTGGTLPSARGVALINLNVASARYVRLTVSSTWAASSDSARYRKLRIDEMWLASDYPGGGGSTTSVEAETGTMSGAAAAASCGTCSGGAKVRFIGNNTTNHVTLTITAATAGPANSPSPTNSTAAAPSSSPPTAAPAPNYPSPAPAGAPPPAPPPRSP